MRLLALMEILSKLRLTVKWIFAKMVLEVPPVKTWIVVVTVTDSHDGNLASRVEIKKEIDRMLRDFPAGMDCKILSVQEIKL